jgi:hypothetical protein
MNGDFARVTFDPARHFSRVLLQQGRMLLEADYNEQSAIHHYFLRTLITDLVGKCWRAGDGFTLDVPTQKDDFRIKQGHFYVDGILCENDSDCSYATQPFGPVPVTQPALAADGLMAYIECWERHVSAYQQPDLREIALPGRDTATRAQIVWQVRVASPDWAKAQIDVVTAALDARIRVAADAAAKVAAQGAKDQAANARNAFIDALGKVGVAGADAANCAAARAFVDSLDLATPRLRAMARRDARNLDPCAIAADSQYRGRENQLYRIEVHASGAAGDATFKWSRENGSVAFRIAAEGITADASVLTIEIEDLGHDRRTGLCEGDWVEITSDAFEFAAIAPSLGQVTKIDRSHRMVTLKVDPADKTDFTACTLLRRWDQVTNLNAAGTIDIVEGSGDTMGWMPIERGIQVQFAPGGVYRTGDYWLIPARVASGDIIWPRLGPNAAAIVPDGVKRHRAPIGFGKKAAGNWAYTPCGCTLKPMCP